MVRFAFTLLVLMCGIYSSTAKNVVGTSSGADAKAYIETVLSPDKTVVGVTAVYSVVVYSNVPDILRVELIEEPSFGNLKISELRLGRSSDTYLGEKKEKGEMWYGYVVDNLLVTSDKPGTFSIKGGKYKICLGIEGYADDWFWGRRRTTVPFWVDASAPDVKLTVKKRPDALLLDSAVSTGDFTCAWNVPPGEINEGNRTIAIYKISGKGMLDRLTVPDFEKAFGDDFKVVYVKPEVRSSLKGTSLWSEMDIIVEFIPAKGGDFTLPSVPFEYLDPESGKMKSCTPPKQTITIKPDKSIPVSKAPIYEI